MQGERTLRALLVLRWAATLTPGEKPGRHKASRQEPLQVGFDIVRNNEINFGTKKLISWARLLFRKVNVEVAPLISKN